MAKGARASTIKANNAALKRKVFGPVEEARTERLSAKLLELASQPRMSQNGDGSTSMDVEDSTALPTPPKKAQEDKREDDMDVDGSTRKVPEKSKKVKGRIEKKKSSRSKAGIVFPKYKAGKRVGGTSRKR